MVIELTDGLARYTEDKRSTLVACLSNLFLGYYEGNLILTASNALCRFIKDRNLLEGERQKAALHYLYNRNGVVPDVLWSVKLVLDKPNPTNHELDISFFEKTESIQPTSMLCENLDDIRFYMKQARCFHPNSPMAVNRRNGGGGTTYDVFNSIKNRKLFCLVILDSDIKYPNCPMGDTAYRFVKNYHDKKVNVEVQILPVHEAENLIPFSFMLGHSCPLGIRFLQKLQKRNAISKLVYYDVKEGIVKEKAEDFDSYKEYARILYETAYPKNRNGFDAFYQHKGDKDNLLPRLNENMLSEYIGNKAEVYRTDELEPFRKKIADLVYTFLCCRNNDPIN